MTLWIRADASATIGLGHLMRCVALGEAARSNGVPVTFVARYDELAQTIIAGRGFEMMLAPDRLPDLTEPGDAVLFDGYDFTVADHDLIPAGVRRGAIDDHRSGSFNVDVLVNPTIPASTDYTVPPGTDVLVGPGFAMVRAEFAPRTATRSDGRRLLVTFGGSDVAGVGHLVAGWAADHERFDVTLLVGPAAPTRPVPDAVEVLRAPKDIGRVFAESDAAISAAGSTTWELCAVGVPMALVQVAENQSDIGSAVARHGAALFLGGAPVSQDAVMHALDTMARTDERTRMSTAALELVDGRGAARVLAALLG